MDDFESKIEGNSENFLNPNLNFLEMTFLFRKSLTSSFRFFLNFYFGFLAFREMAQKIIRQTDFDRSSQGSML